MIIWKKNKNMCLKLHKENDKNNNVFGCYIDRGRENTFLRIEKVADQIFHPAGKLRICKADRQGIDDEHTCHTEDRNTYAASGHFDQSCHCDNADDDLEPLEAGTLIDDRIRIKSKV